MLHFDYQAAERLASDIRSARQSIDNALANFATLTNSVISICCASDAPPASTQAAIEGATIGLTKMVDARKGFVAAHREIAIAQRDSNLQTVDFGCLGNEPMHPSGLHIVNG